MKPKEDRDTTSYTLNVALLNYHLELNGFKNQGCKNFAPEVVEAFKLEVSTNDFLDDVAKDLDI